MKSSSYLIKDNELIFTDNSIISFDFPIKEEINIDDILIIRLEVPIEKIYNENVYGISIKGQKIIWQINKVKYDSENCPFIKIYIKENQLFLRNWCHITFEVNYKTGEITNQEKYLW
jgi:hypothetical protein